MNYIWAPWRMTYIEDQTTGSNCMFCDLLSQTDGPGNLILHRAQHTFVVLNRYPYTNGHMMVVPYLHIPAIDDMEDQALAEWMQITSRAVSVLRQVYGAESFNLGVNIGETAGAGIADHVHMHVVPRWLGDTNFMATTSKTRVIPEALETTYQRLLDGWHALNERS